MSDSETVIREYQEAYVAAYNEQAPDLKCSRGWYRFKRGTGTGYRQRQINEMRDTLLERAKRANHETP